MVLGNHDAQGALTRRQVVDLDRRSPLSLTRAAPEGVTGASHYWLDVHAHGGGHVAARLVFLDSMDRGCESVKGWCGGFYPSAPPLEQGRGGAGVGWSSRASCTAQCVRLRRCAGAA